jgi:hypothetical protein
MDLQTNSQFTGNNTLEDASADGTGQYSLTFDLTSASMVHLTGGIVLLNTLFVCPCSIAGFVAGGIHLTGTGFHFDEAVGFGEPHGTSPPNPSSFDTLLMLAPGLYTLNANYELNVEESYFLSEISNLDVSLQADFTDIPEPAWISYGIGVSMAAAIGFAREFR